MKYKLIKWYPSLPETMEEGDIVRKINGVVDIGCGKTTYGYLRLSYSEPTFRKEEIENNPEFWEKVKNYKILSVKSDGKLFNRREDMPYVSVKGFGLYSKEGTWVDPYDLHDKERIYSVKRLSDGEVFTVGDELECRFNIESFKIKDDQLFTIYNDDHVIYAGEFDKIENIKSKKEPLFTTKDGVDIYGGDKYYHVDDGLNTHSCVAGSKEYTENYITKCFSTEKKALKYIDEHKPKYSVHQVTKAIKEARMASEEIHEGTLKRHLGLKL